MRKEVMALTILDARKHTQTLNIHFVNNIKLSASGLTKIL
jgi:hypothetical protein